jgi:hypothetical protein
MPGLLVVSGAKVKVKGGILPKCSIMPLSPLFPVLLVGANCRNSIKVEI